MAGRIELLVTDQGAGVRHAGTAYATAGDFVISGSGDLELASGRIAAANDVLIGTGGLRGTGTIDAGRHLQVSSARVTLADSALSAGTAATTGASAASCGRDDDFVYTLSDSDTEEDQPPQAQAAAASTSSEAPSEAGLASIFSAKDVLASAKARSVIVPMRSAWAR